MIRFGCNNFTAFRNSFVEPFLGGSMNKTSNGSPLFAISMMKCVASS